MRILDLKLTEHRLFKRMREISTKQELNELCAQLKQSGDNFSSSASSSTLTTSVLGGNSNPTVVYFLDSKSSMGSDGRMMYDEELSERAQHKLDPKDTICEILSRANANQNIEAVYISIWEGQPLPGVEDYTNLTQQQLEMAKSYIRPRISSYHLYTPDPDRFQENVFGISMRRSIRRHPNFPAMDDVSLHIHFVGWHFMRIQQTLLSIDNALQICPSFEQVVFARYDLSSAGWPAWETSFQSSCVDLQFIESTCSQGRLELPPKSFPKLKRFEFLNNDDGGDEDENSIGMFTGLASIPSLDELDLIFPSAPHDMILALAEAFEAAASPAPIKSLKIALFRDSINALLRSPIRHSLEKLHLDFSFGENVDEMGGISLEPLEKLQHLEIDVEYIDEDENANQLRLSEVPHGVGDFLELQSHRPSCFRSLGFHQLTIPDRICRAVQNLQLQQLSFWGCSFETCQVRNMLAQGCPDAEHTLLQKSLKRLALPGLSDSQAEEVLEVLIASLPTFSRLFKLAINVCTDQCRQKVLQMVQDQRCLLEIVPVPFSQPKEFSNELAHRCRLNKSWRLSASKLSYLPSKLLPIFLTRVDRAYPIEGLYSLLTAGDVDPDYFFAEKATHDEAPRAKRQRTD